MVVLGQKRDDYDEKFFQTLKIHNTRIVYYDQLLNQAEEAYGDYLIKEKELSLLVKIAAQGFEN